jgi:manganese/zinc/iron transport system substrate-binding protein
MECQEVTPVRRSLRVASAARAALGLLSCLALAGCGGADRTVPAEPGATRFPIQVTASVGMVADIARNVGAEYVAVHQLLGPGVDPHLYKATRDDVQRLLRCDIVFYVGLMLEGKMIDALVKVGRSKPVYAVTELIDEAFLLEPATAPGHYDPHVWMDIQAWSQCVGAVAEALSRYDPAHDADYAAQARRYRQRLAELHQYALASIGSIPPASRLLITSHDAFNYFGRAYGLEVQGVQGLSTESEAGLQRINELVDEIVRRDVQAVFIESSVPAKNIEALIDGAAARGHRVTIGGQLYSDAMGPAGTYEGTYVGMLDHNVTVVTRALGGAAPRKGLHGRLTSADREEQAP